MYNKLSGTLSLLKVWSNSAPINSEKIQTKLNGPQCTGVKIQTFQLTLNDPTPLIGNTIFIELGLYCSKHCVSNVEPIIDILYLLQYTTGCHNPPPFKKSHPKIYEEREVHRKIKNNH
jgi:hypothetical protein